MTPASTPNTSRNNKDSANRISKSFFEKTVCLKDWWLVKAENDSEGKRLAVAGIASRGNQAVRVFSSAPILRRHDVFTLETVDEIFIIIKGFLDKARTEANGFPSEGFRLTGRTMHLTALEKNLSPRVLHQISQILEVYPHNQE